MMVIDIKIYNTIRGFNQRELCGKNEAVAS